MMANVADHSASHRKVSHSSGYSLKSSSGSSSQTGAKKLVIRNFERPVLPEDYAIVTWDKLKHSVIAIQTSKKIDTPLEELYQAVENLCSHKMAAELYNNLMLLCVDHVKQNIGQFSEEMDQMTFLKCINTCWQNHCDQMVSIVCERGQNRAAGSFPGCDPAGLTGVLSLSCSSF
jgi:cullin-4